MYVALFNETPPAQYRTYLNGQFMVSRAAVHRRSLSFYEHLLRLLTTERDLTAYSWQRAGDGWWECCALENMWHKIFTDRTDYERHKPEEQFCGKERVRYCQGCEQEDSEALVY